MRYLLFLGSILLAGCGGGGENRQPLNQAPQLSAPESVTIPANQTSAIEVQVADDLTDSAALQLSFASGEVSLIPLDQLSIEGNGSNRVLRVTPRIDEIGELGVTLTVEDGSGLATSREMSIEVVPERLSLENFVRAQFLRSENAEPALVNAVVFDEDVFEGDLEDLL